MLYKTLIQPHLDYCSVIWRTGHSGQLHRLQVIQNRCLRMVQGVGTRYNRETLYSSLQVDRLKERRGKQALIFIFKLLYNLAPTTLSSSVQLRSFENYTLRNSNTQIVMPKPRSNFVRNSPLYVACKTFNNLPVHLRRISDIKSFSREIMKLAEIP